MFVCVCRAVTDSQLQRKVAEGADSIRKLNRCTGLGDECGKCIGYARQRIAHHKGAQLELGQQIA